MVRPIAGIDAALAALALAIGVALGVTMVLQGQVTFFYQTHMPSALMQACGWGWVSPVTFVSAMWDFLWGQAANFDCASIPADMAYAPMSVSDQRFFYYREITAKLWTWLGISQQSVWPFVGLAHGLYGMLGFVLSRLYFGRVSASLVALLLLSSSGALTMLSLLRDYLKGPFFLAELILLVLIFRARQPTHLLGLALLAGLVVGVGAGFRPDALLLAPFFLAVIAFCSASSLRVRAASLTIFCTCVIGCFAPAIQDVRDEYHPVIRGVNGVHGTQGLTTPFTANLHLDAPFYDVGHKYSDELIYSTMVGYYSRMPSGPATGSGPYDPLTSATNAQQQYSGPAYYLGELQRFPADIMARGFASALRVMRYFRVLDDVQRHDHPGGIGYGNNYPSEFVVARWHESIIVRFVNFSHMSELGPVLFLGLLFFVSLRDAKEALFLAAVLGTLMIYPAIQFSYRHFFHLEFIYWFGLFACATLLKDWLTGQRKTWKPRPFILATAVVLGIGITALALARWYQDKRIENLVVAHLDAPKVMVKTEKTTVRGRTFARVSVPERQLQILNRPPDDQTFSNLVYKRFGLAQVVEAGIETYIASFGGAACQASELSLTLRYAHGNDTWQALDRTFAISLPPAPANLFTLVFPALYRASQHFEGLELPAESSNCLVSIARLDDRNFNEHPVYMGLNEDWRSQIRHQTIKWR